MESGRRLEVRLERTDVGGRTVRVRLRFAPGSPAATVLGTVLLALRPDPSQRGDAAPRLVSVPPEVAALLAVCGLAPLVRR